MKVTAFAWLVFGVIALSIPLSAQDDALLGESALGESALGESALGESALGESALGESALGESALGESAPLSLRDALALCIERNLDVKVEALNPSIEAQDILIESSEFDYTVFGNVFATETHDPSSSAFTSGGFNDAERIGLQSGVEKKLQTGLEAELTFNTDRFENNSRVDGLSPQYRDFLAINLTQPLLRDFGVDINTTFLRIAKNDVDAAVFGYKDRIRELAYQVEQIYYDLNRAISEYNHRVESKNLAQELLDGNRRKFDAGLVPVSEVQQAESAIAAREELIILALQDIETASNYLKDLLEIRSGDPLDKPVYLTDPPDAASIDLKPFDEYMAVAMEERPDWRQRNIQLGNWDIRLAYSKNQLYPRLDLQTTLGLNGLSGELRGTELFNDDPTLQRNPHAGDYFDSYGNLFEGDGFEAYAGVRVEFPIGNRAAKARLRITEEMKQQAVYRIQRLQGTIETEIRNALINLTRSRERIRAAARFEALAQTALEQEMTILQEGASDAFRILDLQDDLVAARLRKTSAEADYFQGIAELNRALGTTMSKYNIHAGLDASLLHSAEPDNEGE